MTLLVDAGNTALKWALAGADGRPQAVHVEVHRGVNDLAQRLAMKWRTLAAKRAVGCSVASPEVVAAIETAVAENGLVMQWLRSEARYCGAFVLESCYRTPSQLGADRWHGMLGSCLTYPRRSLVRVAAGTATTIDCIEWTSGRAQFIGGCIAPGARLMLESLARGTAGLPHAAGRAVDFADNTDDAIATGVIDAQVGLVGRMVQRFALRLGGPADVVVSGGDAEPLVQRLNAGGIASSIAHNLVLAGLALRARDRPPVTER
jgi:type III pantothenate kinase